MENSKTFINKFNKDVDDGAYDKYLTLPFLTKDLLKRTVKGKVKRRLEKGGTPVLTEAEIKSVISDLKETAGTTFYLFVKYGFLEKTEDGTYSISRKGAIALREAHKI